MMQAMRAGANDATGNFPERVHESPMLRKAASLRTGSLFEIAEGPNETHEDHEHEALADEGQPPYSPQDLSELPEDVQNTLRTWATAEHAGDKSKVGPDVGTTDDEEDLTAQASLHPTAEDLKAWDEEDVAARRRCWKPFEIIHPQSPFKYAWDMFLMLCIFYSVWAIPFRIGFDVASTVALTVIDALQDCFFACDIFINFFTAYVDSFGRHVANREKIAVRYMKTWLIADLISTLPVDYVVSAVLDDTGAPVFRSLRLLRVVRLFKLIRLVRLVKLRKAISRLEDTGLTNPAVTRLFRMLYELLFLAHVIACIWHFIPIVEAADSSWYMTAGIDDTSTLTSRYVASVYWTVATMMTVGYGDIHAVTSWERVLSFTTMMIGVSFMGFLVSSISRLLANVDARATTVRAKLSEVREYCLDRKLPVHLQRRVMSYITYKLAKQSVFAEGVMLNDLSSSLRNELLCHAHRRVIHCVKLLSEQDACTTAALVSSMTPLHAVAGDVITNPGSTPTEWFLCLSGIVEAFIFRDGPEAGKQHPEVIGVFATGDHFGHCCLIRNCPHCCGFKALVHTELMTLRKELLDGAISMLPDFENQLRQLAEAQATMLEHVIKDVHAKFTIHDPAMTYTEIPVLYRSRLVPKRHIKGYLEAKHIMRLQAHSATGIEQQMQASGEEIWLVRRPKQRDPRRSRARVSVSAVRGAIGWQQAVTQGQAVAIQPIAPEPASLAKTSFALPTAHHGSNNAVSPSAIDSKSVPAQQEGTKHRLQMSAVLSNAAVAGSNASAATSASTASASGVSKSQAIRAAALKSVADFDNDDDAHAEIVVPIQPAAHPSSVNNSHAADIDSSNNPSVTNASNNSHDGPFARRQSSLKSTDEPEAAAMPASRTSVASRVSRSSASSHTAKPGDAQEAIRSAEPTPENKPAEEPHIELNDEDEGNTGVSRGEYEDVQESSTAALRRFVCMRNSRLRTRWDLFMLVVTIVSLILSPLQISFFSAAEDDGGIFVIQLMIDIVFLLDILFNFRTSFTSEHTELQITVPRLMAAHYFKSWFTLDALASLPIEIIVRICVAVLDSNHSADSLDILEMFRLLRFLRLLRLSKLSRALTQLEMNLSVPLSVFKLLRLVFEVSFGAHILGCLWYLVGTTTRGDMPYPATWVEREAASPVSAGTGVVDSYVASLYWAFTTLTTVGYGDILAVSNTERVFAAMSMLIGGTVFGYVIGNISGIIGMFDLHAVLREERNRTMKEYLREIEAPTLLRRRVLQHYDYMLNATSVFDEKQLLSDLSETLRNEVILFLNKETIAHLPFFQNQGDMFIVHVASLLRPQLALPGEFVFREGEVGLEMYFLSRGVAELVVPGKNGLVVRRTFQAGDYFGELALLHNARRSASIRAVTYLHLFALSKLDLSALIEKYPTVAPMMQRAMEQSIRQLGRSGSELRSRLLAEQYGHKWLSKARFGQLHMDLSVDTKVDDELESQHFGLQSPRPPTPTPQAVSSQLSASGGSLAESSFKGLDALVRGAVIARPSRREI